MKKSKRELKMATFQQIILGKLTWLAKVYFDAHCTGFPVCTQLFTGILLPKLFWPTVRKKCCSDREKPLKFEAEGREFAKFSRSLEQFIQTVKGQNNFW